MIPFLPRQIASKAIVLYLIALGAVTFLYFSHAMSLVYIVMGIVWVVGFFLLTSFCSKKWKEVPQKRFLTSLALTSAGVRLVWVVFSYFFYTAYTGIPFEFDAADSLGYWEDGVWLATLKWPEIIEYLSFKGVSDSGYLLYLTCLYKIIGPNIIVTRLLKVMWSTATVVLIYQLTKRNIGEEGARLAAIMACFMPNLIVYCGLHLKETEMLFLVIAFLERSDYLLRTKKYNVFTIAVPLLLLVSLFAFRTVLGVSGVIAFISGLVFTNTSVVGRRKKVMIVGWAVAAAVALGGGTIINEVEGAWEERSTNQETKRLSQTMRGNRWAKYSTGAVMAPMMFVMPFPTMVDVDEQYNQQILSGGNYVRNFLGGFVLLALYCALFVKKNWRDLSLLGAFVVAYLGIIAMSGFANSERFLLPGLPLLLIIASYGITLLNARYYRFIKIWYWIVPVMSIAWAFFKLGSRGLF